MLEINKEPAMMDGLSIDQTSLTSTLFPFCALSIPPRRRDAAGRLSFILLSNNDKARNYWLTVGK
jgi:hypothetical protein